MCPIHNKKLFIYEGKNIKNVCKRCCSNVSKLETLETLETLKTLEKRTYLFVTYSYIKTINVHGVDVNVKECRFEYSDYVTNIQIPQNGVLRVDNMPLDCPEKFCQLNGIDKYTIDNIFIVEANKERLDVLVNEIRTKTNNANSNAKIRMLKLLILNIMTYKLLWQI